MFCIYARNHTFENMLENRYFPNDCILLEIVISVVLQRYYGNKEIVMIKKNKTQKQVDHDMSFRSSPLKNPYKGSLIKYYNK